MIEGFFFFFVSVVEVKGQTFISFPFSGLQVPA